MFCFFNAREHSMAGINKKQKMFRKEYNKVDFLIIGSSFWNWQKKSVVLSIILILFFFSLSVSKEKSSYYYDV